MNADMKGAVSAIDCPSCGGSIALQASGFTNHVGCQYCGSELNVASDQVRLIKEHSDAMEALEIPLGTHGTLKDVEWAAIGYIERADSYGSWGDYLLFNPYHGYRWLTRTQGGWSFGIPLMSQPAPPHANGFRYDGRQYSPFYEPSENEVTHVLGEFYWKVSRGDRVRARDYVSGDRMLSLEISGDEYNWTLGEWIPAAEIEQAFGTPPQSDYPRTGAPPLPHQPNPHTKTLKQLALIGAAVLMMGLIFNVIFSAGGGAMATTSFTAGQSEASRNTTLGPFEISGSSKPFTIKASVEPGQDNWADIGFRLVNIDTGEAVAANQPLGFYSGRDWKEDDRRGTLKIAAVPPGKYELEIEVFTPESEAAANGGAATLDTNGWTGGRTYPVTITAGPGGSFVSNFVIFAILLFLPVLVQMLRASSFTAARLSDSDYHGSDDDD